MALWIAIADENTPYKQALYEERWHSYDLFARTSTEFDSALADANAAITNNVDKPETLDKMTVKELLAASKGAAPVLVAKRHYSQDLAAVLGPWPTSVVKAVLAADVAGNTAMECHILLGVHGEDLAQRTDWWNYVRDQAKTHCAGLHKSRAPQVYDAVTKVALGAMRDAIRKDDQGLIPGQKPSKS